MKAVIWPKYGPPDVLQLREVEKPVPKADEVLIRVVAASVFVGDCEMRRFDFPLSFWLPLRLAFGVFKPRAHILGQELAGVVEAIGSDVTQFQVGDEVFGPTDMRLGAYAQYRCLRGKHPMAIKPASMSFDEAATVPTGGLNALHFVRKASIQPGERVLINGAAGSIGTFAVQIAKHLGAEVTAVDSPAKLALLRDLGADHVIDYTSEDFTQTDNKYDVIIDIVGKSAYGRSIRALNRNGRYVLGNPRLPGMLRGLLTSLLGKKKVIIAIAPYRTDDLHYLRTMIESGTLRTVIDRRYPLEQVVDAHRYVESGEKCGQVVLTMPPVSGEGGH